MKKECHCGEGFVPDETSNTKCLDKCDEEHRFVRDPDSNECVCPVGYELMDITIKEATPFEPAEVLPICAILCDTVKHEKPNDDFS